MKLEEIGFYTLSDERARNVSLTSPLWRCELLLTSKCNFKCPYCRGIDKSADISFDYAKYIIDLWAGLKNIRFSGGEPTLVKWLPDIVKYAKDKGIKRIAVSTNGSDSIDNYKNLIKMGVNDFSISLDACCSSFGDKMTGVQEKWKNIVKVIKELSKLTYITVGCVFDENNIDYVIDTILFAHTLGVADIRIINAAQFPVSLGVAKEWTKIPIIKHPILKYRIINSVFGRSVRGIKLQDSKQCSLVIDDMAIKGKHHYPCIIYLREGGKPIGEVGEKMRKERFGFFKEHNTHKDSICRKNCLDVCVDYNNKVKALEGE